MAGQLMFASQALLIRASRRWSLPTFAGTDVVDWLAKSLGVTVTDLLGEFADGRSCIKQPLASA